MSKSVKSYASSGSRRERSNKQIQNAHIKDRIKEILYSVKEERQHIENRLHQNERELQRLRDQYEILRYDNDFDTLNAEEEIIVAELAQGLQEMGVDPVAILGKCAAGKSEGKGRQLTKEEIIRVQEVLLTRLQNQILQK